MDVCRFGNKYCFFCFKLLDLLTPTNECICSVIQIFNCYGFNKNPTKVTVCTILLHKFIITSNRIAAANANLCWLIFDIETIEDRISVIYFLSPAISGQA